MKGYKNVSNNLNNSKAAKNSSHSSYNEASTFHTTDQDTKNKRKELIKKYNDSLKK
jgi:hypothetical protein